MNKDIRKITEGAMMVALIGMMLFIDRQFAGELLPFFNFLLPLPLVYFCVKYGIKSGILIVAVIFLLTLILGYPQIIFMVMSSVLLGVVYGSGIERKTDSIKLFLQVFFVAVAVNIIDFYFISRLFGIDPMEAVYAIQEQTLHMIQSVNIAMPQNINITSLLQQIFYFSFVFMSLLQTYVLHIFSYLFLKRLHISIPSPKPISSYQPKKWTGYLAMGCLLLFLFAQHFMWFSETVMTYLYSLAMFAEFYMGIFGWLAGMLFIKKSLGKMSLILKLMLCFFMIAYIIILAMIGFLYITTDLRSKLLGGDFNATKKR